MVKRIYDFEGIIQGVGFRPCISRLAQEHDISGWIQNRSGSVRAEFIGDEVTIASLLSSLQSAPPPLARIDRISLISEEETQHADGNFTILEGQAEESRNIMIPADVAICPDCLAEINDPTNRRYMYPFTTCVNCGPRYTVITDMPYARNATTMKVFPLCPDCEAEYTSPADRRFHAETTCCSACGPQLSLLEAGNTKQRWVLASLTKPDTAGTSASTQSQAALAAARKAIADGKIVGVKGIGGFLLAIDPRNNAAVAELRERKRRPHKPLAVMARSMDLLKNSFDISIKEEQLLRSPQSPIVIINTDTARNPGFELNSISPDTKSLGVMLPTSPLHVLLLESALDDPTPAFDYLVMTSGNKRSEPICLTTDEACDRLNGIADLILTHNRDISLRNDDSLCIVNSSGPQVWRRARGFAPSPVVLNIPLTRNILAMGAEIKNTLAIGYDSEVVLSPHIGDLETPEAIEHMRVVAKALPAFLCKSIEAVAVDLNPDMHSSVTGRLIAEELGVPVVEVQHHEAHALACLSENGVTSGFALTFDGTGMGSDGTIWGAELFYIDENRCRRLATYKPAPLPGGDSAVRHPVRQLIGRLAQAGTVISNDILSALRVTPEEAAIWSQQYHQGINCALSSGAGRLFDSMAALLGCAPEVITYEGQPAIRLENLARHGTPDADIIFNSVERNGLLEIDWDPFFASLNSISTLREKGAAYAMAMHQAVINSAITMIEYGRSKYPIDKIALSGGVLMNQIIHHGLTERIRAMKLTPLTHSLTPPNDGCISLGQVVAAGHRIYNA